MNNMISYYELLGMIKDKTFPEEVILHMCSEAVIYEATYNNVDSSFDCYVIKNEDDEDCDFKFYLSECFLESMMFEKCIEIKVNTKNNDIPKHLTNEFIQSMNSGLCPNDVKSIAHKVNEIINYLEHARK